MFLSSGMDKCLKIWDANSLTPADVFLLDGKIYQHNMAPTATQHNLVALATTANHVQLADLRSGGRSHELRGHTASVLSVKWSPSQEFQLASGSMDNRLLMWDVRASRSCLFSMDQHNGRNHAGVDQTSAHNGYVHGLSFTGDGLFLVSVGTDGRMRLWNADNGKIFDFNKHEPFVTLFSFFQGGMKWWITEKFPWKARKEQDLTCLAIRILKWFSYHRKETFSWVYPFGILYIIYFLTLRDNNGIQVYELTTGLKRATLLGHYNTVTCCVYNENFQTLYSGANDRNILVWAAERDTMTDEDSEPPTNGAHTSRSLVPRRNLTQDAWSSDEDWLSCFIQKSYHWKVPFHCDKMIALIYSQLNFLYRQIQPGNTGCWTVFLVRVRSRRREQTKTTGINIFGDLRKLSDPLNNLEI